jgi:hypothetical protein
MSTNTTTNTVVAQDLIFNHFVVANNQGLIFASARDKVNRIYNFLVNEFTGNVMQQINDKFEPVQSRDSEHIKDAVYKLRNVLPTYHIRCFDFS